MPTPTHEQVHAADTFRAGRHLALQAGAGTGKTSTLCMLAAGTKRRGRYLAFNKDIAQDAAARFPSTVQCRTAHATAFAALGHRYADRLNSPRQPAWKTGQSLGILRPVRIADHEISQRTLSHNVLRTVTRFCHSADSALAQHHVPRLRGLDAPAAHWQFAELVLPFAAKAWADLQRPDHGIVRFEHDHYLKMWALTRPKIEADFLLLDEAQDTNPVLEQVFTAQRDHAQLVMVGDSAQAIYGWRGATDVMTGFDAEQLTLTRSFRFGPQIANEANRWLALADAPIRLTGTTSVPAEVSSVDHPDAVLCRTNIGAMTEVMRLLGEGHRVALTRGGQQLAQLASAARDLKEGAALITPSWCCSRPGATCRTTPPTIRPTATCSPSSTSSTPTVPTPSSLPCPTSPRKHTPTSPSPPPTKPKAANGRPSGSATTSPSRRTPTPARARPTRPRK